VGINIPELLLIVCVALIFFGGKKLPGLGDSVGRAVRDFKRGLKEPEEIRLDNVTPPAPSEPSQPNAAQSQPASKTSHN